MSLRVAIVGGGIGGLSTAVALRAIGAQVEVFEQARQIGDVGAGVGLQQNSQGVLRRLGLDREIRRIAAPVPGMRIYDPDGVTLSSTAFAADAAQLGVHRADLVAVLAAALPTEAIHIGRRCTQFSQQDGSATVHFDSGEEVDADVVIAADGIHSVLQRYVVDATEPVFSGTVAYRGLVPATRLTDWPRSLVVWAGRGKHLLAFPVRAGQLINFVGFVPADEQMRESWSAPGDPDVLASEFADWDPRARQLLDRVETTFKWGLYDRNPLTSWTNGRLALLGDAAHPMLPHLGQGANQAIEDAMALATFLRGASPADVPRALVHYQALRRHRTARIQQLSRSNGIRFDAGLAAQVHQPWIQDYDVEAHAASAVKAGAK